VLAPVLRPDPDDVLEVGPTTAEVAERVTEARGRQLARQGCVNGALTDRQLLRHGGIEEAATKLLDQLYARGTLSMRGAHRVLRVARTIADIQGDERVGRPALARALTMRQDLVSEDVTEVAA
jgi:magnesium chelatase family protein